MCKYPIGYVATVFYYGNATKFKYAGNGEWEFVSGINSPAMYNQLLELVK
jgi:hypothetical protein